MITEEYEITVEYSVPELRRRPASYEDVADILGAFRGINGPGINTDTGILRVTFMPNVVKEEEFLAALRKAGFALERLGSEDAK